MRPKRPAFEAWQQDARRRGLRSLYHEHNGEDPGKERRPTHLFRRDPTRPFHIDYIYASEGLDVSEFEIGRPKDWLDVSDHVPLRAQFEQKPLKNRPRLTE